MSNCPVLGSSTANTTETNQKHFHCCNLHSCRSQLRIKNNNNLPCVPKICRLTLFNSPCSPPKRVVTAPLKLLNAHYPARSNSVAWSFFTLEYFVLLFLFVLLWWRLGIRCAELAAAVAAVSSRSLNERSVAGKQLSR